MDKNQVSNEKKLTLLLLCWLFGIFAVHRFYTGKYRTGGLQLLLWGLAGILQRRSYGCDAIAAVLEPAADI